MVSDECFDLSMHKFDWIQLGREGGEKDHSDTSCIQDVLKGKEGVV